MIAGLLLLVPIVVVGLAYLAVTKQSGGKNTSYGSGGSGFSADPCGSSDCSGGDAGGCY